MKALAFSSRSFARFVRCTVTSESLRDLANALVSGGPTALHHEIVALDRRAAVKSGRQTCADVDFTNQHHYLLTLANGDCDAIAESLRRLADEPDRSAVSLAKLGLLTVETSNYDLEFFKLDEVAELMPDYEPDVSGSTWEGVLYHPIPPLTRFRHALDLVLGWAVPSDNQDKSVLVAQSSDPDKIVDLATAHRRLLDQSDQTFQITTFIDHPLVVWFGNPHTEAQVWLTTTCSEIIVSEHCVASGDFRVDINNFFSFRRVLLAMSDALNATGIAWGECADRWPTDRVADPASFINEDEMWTNFVTVLQPCLGEMEIPPFVRVAFSKKFVQEITQSR